jgi:diacylglycerol kinase family enzyme
VAILRVSVIINSKAGSVNPALVEAKIRESLFRCDLHISKPKTLEEMCDFIHQEVQIKTDFLLIAGGDGTINACLQCLMRCQDDWSKIPPIAIVKSGTANDLATEIGVSTHISRAARNILEGQVRRIDVIEIEGDGQKKYMLTNGGIGIPAVTAQLANQFRDQLRNASNSTKMTSLIKNVTNLGYKAVKGMGSGIYSLMIAEALRTWDQTDWSLDLMIPGSANLETSAPIILISNQARLGSNFLPAPFTSNSDGTVNLLLADSKTLVGHVQAALQIKRGRIEQNTKFKTFELKEFSLKARNSKRSLTFFGDGEILLSEAPSITVRCLAKGLPIVVGV